MKHSRRIGRYGATTPTGASTLAVIPLVANLTVVLSRSDRGVGRPVKQVPCLQGFRLEVSQGLGPFPPTLLDLG